LIGGKVAQPLYAGLQINVMGTINVAEAVRLTESSGCPNSTMGTYDRRLRGDRPSKRISTAPGEAYGNSKVAKS
jgi:nucleoside-diphosphate-sugar epimerase